MSSLTKKHLIEITYHEFSTRRIERFTLVELAKKATVSRTTIYNNFGSLEHLYKDIVEEIIVEEITRNCQSHEELIRNLVAYIYDNKLLCMNLYRQTASLISQEHIHQQIAQNFIKLLVQCNENQVVSEVAIDTFILVIKKQFDCCLKVSQSELTESLIRYEQFLFYVQK